MAEEIEQSQQQQPKPSALSLVQSALAKVEIGKGVKEKSEVADTKNATANADAAALQKQPETLAAQVAQAASEVAKDEKTAEAAAPKYATAEDIQRIVADAIKGTSSQNAATTEMLAKRSNFIAKNMADAPEPYRDMMPKTGDENTLKAAMYAINSRINEDFEAMMKNHRLYGPAIAEAKKRFETSTGGITQGGGTPAYKAPLDYSRMTPSQLVSLGLNQSQAKNTNGNP